MTSPNLSLTLKSSTLYTGASLMDYDFNDSLSKICLSLKWVIS